MDVWERGVWGWRNNLSTPIPSPLTKIRSLPSPRTQYDQSAKYAKYAKYGTRTVRQKEERRERPVHSYRCMYPISHLRRFHRVVYLRAYRLSHVFARKTTRFIHPSTDYPVRTRHSVSVEQSWENLSDYLGGGGGATTKSPSGSSIS